MNKPTGEIFEGEFWKLTCGDWRESTPDRVDHVITDPPYDERTHLHGAFAAGEEFGISEFDPINPLAIVPRLLDVAQRWVLAFCVLEAYGLYQYASGECWVRSGVWRKPNAPPQFSGDRPAQGAEGIAIMHAKRPGRMEWNGGGKHGVWTANTCRGAGRFHKTQKPLKLCLELVEDFTELGDVVFDPFAGAASFGVACIIRGRHYIGHEINPEYATMAAERLAGAKLGLSRADFLAGQQSLFGGEQL